MSTVDASEEWRRLTELYRGMTNGELLEVARDFSDLTDAAKPILAQELRGRGLVMPKKEEPAPLPEPDPDDPYAEDRELVTLCTVWSEADALQMQNLLDRAGIPFFMGPENATGVDKIASGYAVGIDVKVMRVGLPWARQLLPYYEPKDEPDLPQEKEPEDLAIRCPQCGSEDVIFGDEANAPEDTGKLRSKFDWICGVCGHQWEDDGVVKEK